MAAPYNQLTGIMVSGPIGDNTMEARSLRAQKRRDISTQNREELEKDGMMTHSCKTAAWVHLYQRSPQLERKMQLHKTTPTRLGHARAVSGRINLI